MKRTIITLKVHKQPHTGPKGAKRWFCKLGKKDIMKRFLIARLSL
jgi:hypothetical protein